VTWAALRDASRSFDDARGGGDDDQDDDDIGDIYGDAPVVGVAAVRAGAGGAAASSFEFIDDDDGAGDANGDADRVHSQRRLPAPARPR
jgi:hypothetical protein